MKPYKLQKFEATVAQHDRLQTNSEMHDMRYRIYREMRDRFIREEKAKVAQAYAFSNNCSRTDPVSFSSAFGAGARCR